MIKVKYFCLLCFVFLLIGCEKESDLSKPASIAGIALDQVANLPIPYAKVTLYELEPHESPWFIFWEAIDVQTADSEGAFHFDYKGKQSHLYGLKADEEGYYEQEEVNVHFRRTEVETNVYALPKSYVQIRLIDELPLMPFDSLWVRTTTYAPITKIFNHFSDTTIIAPVTPEVAGLAVLTFWNGGERNEFRGNASCTAHDTCSVVYRY